MLARVLISLAFLFGQTAVAKELKDSVRQVRPLGTIGPSELQVVANRYREANLVSMDIDRRVKTILGKETQYKGKAFLSQKKFRVEQSEPSKELIVFDGKSLWQVTDLQDGEKQVARTDVSEKTEEFFFISYLLNQELLLKKATLDLDRSTKKQKVFRLDFNRSDLKDLWVQLNEAGDAISGLGFKDDLDQESVINFSNIRFSGKSKPGLFKYQPNSKTKVIDL